MTAGGPRPGRHIAGDYVPIGISLLLWGWTTPIFKYLQSQGCDAYAMIFYRTLAAAAGMGLWLLVRPPAGAVLTRRALGRYLFLGLLFGVGLALFVVGTYRTSATLAILITRAIPLFTIVLSSLLFADERRTVAQPGFKPGFAVAAGGLLGLCLARESGGGWTWNAGAGLLLVAAAVWSVYSLCVKSWLAGVPPLLASVLVFTAALPPLLAALLWRGHPEWLWEAPALPVAVLLASGPIIMGVGECLCYVSIRRIGLAPTTSATLCVPFLTALFAWPALGEIPTLPMVCFGLVLLAGLALIVRARMRLVAVPEGELLEPIAGRQGMAAVSAGVVRPTTEGLQRGDAEDAERAEIS